MITLYEGYVVDVDSTFLNCDKWYQSELDNTMWIGSIAVQCDSLDKVIRDLS